MYLISELSAIFLSTSDRDLNNHSFIACKVLLHGILDLGGSGTCARESACRCLLMCSLSHPVHIMWVVEPENQLTVKDMGLLHNRLFLLRVVLLSIYNEKEPALGSTQENL